MTLGADKALIHLGDMPEVKPELLMEVIEHCTDRHASAARGEEGFSPPACFPESLFPQLLGLDGDKGARALLQSLPIVSPVPVSAQSLIDVDTPDDLETFKRF